MYRRLYTLSCTCGCFSTVTDDHREAESIRSVHASRNAQQDPARVHFVKITASSEQVPAAGQAMLGVLA